MTDDEEQMMRARQVRAVTSAVAKLLPRLAGDGFTPEAIFEGSIKGAAVQMIASGASAETVAELLDDMAAAFRDLDRPNLTLVQ